MPITVLDHPLAGHLLTLLRDEQTPPERYRTYAKRLTTLLALEGTRSMTTETVRVRTPLEETEGRRLADQVAAIPILRAGLGMLDPVLELFPKVSVGYVGLERNEETAVARRYYVKLPKLAGRHVLLLDPMLATGGSAVQAVSLIKEYHPARVVMLAVIATPEGVDKLLTAHPDVQIVTAALDRGLDERKYILPGLGDFGDRLFGTQ